MSSNSGAASPACYPKNYSYRKVLDRLNNARADAARAESEKLQKAPKSEKSASEKSVSEISSMCGGGPVIAPSFTSRPGDIKVVHRLQGGGKLVILKKKDNEGVSYQLSLPDGRRVYLDKSSTDASLCITDCQGRAIKTIACEM